MDFGHASRYASREARRLTGDFFPGPVLMPHGVLRTMEPVLAVALGPARAGGEAFEAALERTLRGRPDGPLLLALWAAIAVGEIPHRHLRNLVHLMPRPLPELPEGRGELLAFLHPRVSAVASCLLSIAEHPEPEALAPAERLGLGIAVTALLAGLPAFLAAGRMPLPKKDLESAGLDLEELRAGLRSPAVHRFLLSEAAWARSLLDQGLELRAHLGARLRRGVRAVVVRSRHLLDQVEDPTRDVFRNPPRLGRFERWACALQSMLGIPRSSPGPGAALDLAPTKDGGN